MQIEDSSRVQSIKEKLFSECKPNAPLFESSKLFSESFLWTYTHGERHLNNKKFTNANDARLYLLFLAKNADRLFYEVFENFFTEITHEIKSELETLQPAFREVMQLSAEDLWRDLVKTESANATNSDTNEAIKPRGYLMVSEIFNLDMPVNLRNFLQILNIVANFHDAESKLRLGKDEL